MVKRLQIDGVMGLPLHCLSYLFSRNRVRLIFYQADFCDYTKQKSQCPEGHWLFCM